MLKKLSIITSNQEVGALTSKTISNKLLLNAYNAFDNNSGSNSLIFELTSNEASISLYDQDTEVKTNVIELNNNYVNIPGNITFDGNINSISKNELNTLLNNDNNIKETFTSHATNILNTSNHIYDIDTKFITDISALDTRITDNDTDISALDTRITGNDTDISALNTRITNNENYIVDTSNYLYKIESKTSNIEIIESGNIKLKSDLTITGELTVTDLNVTGSTTTIHTDDYTTESLHIQSSGLDAVALKITHDTNSYDIIQVINKYANQVFTINPIGNVGIGTTTPGSKLDVDGDINISSGSSFKINGSAIATTDTTYSAGTGITISGTTINSQITQYEDSNVLTLLNTTGVTGGLKVTSGNITSYDSLNLFLYGNGNSEKGIFFRSDHSSGSKKYNSSILIYDHGGGVSGSTPDGISINAYDGISFCTSSNTRNERMRIASNGNVGIGVLSPNYKLDIAGDINISSGSSFKINGSAIATTDTTYSAGTGITIDGTTINSQITQYSDSNVETLLSTNAINIGIGIAAHSSATLTINKETRFEGTERTSHLNHAAPEHTYIRGGKNTSYVLLNDNGGYVGVGTGTPQYTLDVSGNINFTGTLTKSGNAFTSYTDSDVLTLLNTTGVTGGLKVTTGTVGIGQDNTTHMLRIYHNESYGFNNTTKIASWYSAFGIENQGGAGVGMSFKNNQEIGYIYYGNSASWVGQGAFGIATEATGNSSDLKLVIQKVGNVGIGVLSPNYKLDIAGDINISAGSRIFINNQAIATTDTTYSAGTGITIDGTTINCDIVDTTLLVSDTTPQLGGDLDVNEKDIVSATDKNINIDPAGNGNFVIKGNTTRGSGSIMLNCENNSHGVKIKGPPHSAGASYTLTLPPNVGSANQLLSTDGSGSLSFITPAASYTNSDVTTLLNSGVSGGIVSLNDLTVHGDIKKVTSGGSDPTINPSVSVNNIDSSTKSIILQNTGGDQTSYDITFSSDTICDILIIGGGGSGAQNTKAGAGAGGLVYIHNANITEGTYNILVGKGGAGGDGSSAYRSGVNGFNSTFDNIIALGGGGGYARYTAGNYIDGGSGGGGHTDNVNYPGISLQHIENQNTSYTIYQYGNDGTSDIGMTGGGGGAGGQGYSQGVHPNVDIMGGVGLSEISETGINIDFKTHFGITNTSIGHHINENGTDKVYFAGGGSGSRQEYTGGITPGQKGGGGGSAHYTVHINDYPEVYDALPNTGGGGGGTGNTNREGRGGGWGGSGIVIIRFATSTETIIESYSDDKVENVLTNKGGANITWNTNTKQFDCDVINTDVDVNQANFDAKFNLKTVDDVSQANWDAKYNSTSIDTLDVSQANWDSKFDTTGRTINDVSQANFNTKFTSRLNSDVTFNGHINLANGKNIKLGAYSYIGEDIDDVDSLSIIADYTENICFSGYDRTGTRPTTTNTTERMRIDRYGKVGIGTTTPTERLHLMHWDQITSPIDILTLEHNLGGNTTQNGTAIKFVSNWMNGDKHTIARIRGLSNDNTAISDNYFSGFLMFETQTGGTANDTTSERMRITNIGNVGIGVTDPSEILHIIGNFRIETRPNETSSIDIKSDTGGFKIKYDDINNNLKFITDNSGTEYELLTMDRTNNRIGIGTNSPNTKLQIYNSSTTPATGANTIGRTTTPSEVLRLQSKYHTGHGSGALIRFTNHHNSGDNPNNDEYNLAGIAGIDDDNNWGGGMVFYTAEKGNSGGGDLVPRILINSDGNVGIGTNSPEHLLHLKGGATSAGGVQLKIENESYNKGIQFNYTSATSGTYDFIQAKIYTTGTSYDSDLHFATADGSSSYKIDDLHPNSTLSTHMTIRYDGNVGIGTTTPGSKLDVNGDVNVTGTITATNLDITGSTTTIHTDDYTTESLHIQSSGNDAVALKITHDTTNHDIMEVIDSSTNQVFTIDSSGNVGIGTDPTEKLDINGNIKFTGTINDITTTELSYLDGITQNINTNFTNTSNHIDLIDSKFIILDQDNSNYILDTSNNLINYVNTSISENAGNNFTGNANEITSGVLDVDRLPIDGITIYKDGDVIKALTQEVTDTSINAFIGTYINSTKYSDNINRASNIITIDGDKMVYDTSIINSTINTISDNPKFYTSEIIYPNNILQHVLDFDSIEQQWNDGVFIIKTISSDTIYENYFNTYGTFQLFNHILSQNYKSGNVYYSNGTYGGTNNFKNNIGLSISIDLGRSIYLRKMKFMPKKHNSNNAMPKFFKIYATDTVTAWNSPFDGSWTLLYDNTNEISYNDNEFTTFGNFANINTKYRYFTLVVTEINGDATYLAMTEFAIIGVEDITITPTLIDASNNTYSISLPYSDLTSTKVINEPKILPVLSNSLIAFYSFNGDFYTDRNPTTTKYHLTASGTPELSSSVMIEGQSVYFNANNEFLSTSVNFPMQFGISFSFWFKRDDNNDHDILMAIGSDFFIMAHTSNQFYISNTYGGSEIYAFVPITWTSEWYHLVFKINASGTWQIYINNSEITFTTNGSYPLTLSRLPQGKLYIGGKNVGYWDVDHDTEGYIDNFRVYNKSLTDYEITEIYTNSITDSNNLEFNKNNISYYNNLTDGLHAHYIFMNDYVDSINSNNVVASANSSFNNNELYSVKVPSEQLLIMPANACAPLFDTNNNSTFAFWVKVDTVTDDGNAIFGANKNYGGGLYSRYICQLTGTTLHWTRNYKRDSNGNKEDDASISCVLSNNYIGKWFHIAFVSLHDEPSKIYINGVSQLITNQYGTPDNNDIYDKTDYLNGEDLYLGGNTHITGGTYHSGTEYFSDMRVYNRALSTNEIQQLINSKFIENINIDSDYNAIVLKHNPNNTDHTDYLLNFDTNVETEVLIIAGGGAGGTRQGYNAGGGGGAGEVLEQSISLDASMKYTIRVGRGGFSSTTDTAPAEEGKDSRIYNDTGQVIALVKGGGRGGFGKRVSSYSWPPTSGGSAGGRARGDNGTAIQSSKYNGSGFGNNGSTSGSEAGGGGGAGSAATSGNRNPGSGYTSTITGISTNYASGGYGGWQYGANLSDDGYGSGGAGATATTNDTSISPGEYGNPGIVIIKYKKTFTSSKYNVISPILQSDTTNLISKYSFEYNLNDESGNNHHLVGYNTHLTYVDKVYDNCSVLLDGTNGETYLEFPDTINLYNIWNDGDGLTFSIWFNMHSTTDEYGRILEFAYQTIKFNNESQYRLGIMRHLTANYINIYWKEDSTNGSATIPCDLNVWNNLVFSVSKLGLWSVYLNNINQDINITFSPPNRTYNVKVIGRSSYSTTQNFNGLIDDFRIYNKVLSSNEIKILYESKFQTIYNINVPQGIFSDILLVGGGGSGGGTLGGGGGGGGVLYKSQNFIPTNNYVVRVGKGGDKVQRDQSNSWMDIGINGIYTSAMDTIIFGGGGGGNYQSISGSSGGSGGGGGFTTSSGGSFIPPIYGNVIINGTYTGSQGESVASANKSGDGGNTNGVIYSITGTSYRYAKGGVGSENNVDTNRTNSHGINYGDGGGGSGWTSGTYSGDGGNGVCVFKYTLSTLSTSNYIISTPDTEKVSSGDLILINNGGIRRVFNTTSEHFTLYNEEQNDIGTIPSTAIGFTKINNLLLFNVSGDIDNNSVYISNVSEYTKITIPITDIYTIKISAIFDLEFATEFCELHIRLDRSGYSSRYIRTFYLPPISSYEGHDSSTLNCSVDLNLQENDILVFESNYKLSSKLPSYITFANSGTTVIQGSLIQNIISGSGDSSLTFQSPLLNVDNTVSLDLSQITTNNLVFESPLVKFNNNVSISTNAYAQYSHKHDASDIHTGVLSIDRIPTLSTLYSVISDINDTSNYINIIDAKTSNIDVINNTDINFNGNVNIGINTIYSTNTKLYVKGTSSGYTQPLVKITQDGSWDGNYALEVDGYTNFGEIRINGADTGNSIFKADAGNMALTTNNGDIILNPNGNVGIGITNPNSKLHISNNSTPSANITLLTLTNGNGTSDLGGAWSDNTSTNIDFVFTDSNPNFTPQGRIKCLNGRPTDNGIDSEGTGNLCFYTGTGNDGAGGGILNEIMRLTYDEKVGIGVTNPQAKLHVYVDSDTNNNLVEILRLERHCDDLSTNANAEGGYICLKVDDDNASLGELARISWRGDNADNGEDSGRLGFWTTKDDSCTEKLTITKDGYVGIGTTSPASKLDVNGDMNVTGTITAANLDITGATTTIHTDSYTTESLHIQSSGSDAVAFKITHDTINHDIMEVNNSSGTQIFTIDANNNVGIGAISANRHETASVLHIDKGGTGSIHNLLTLRGGTSGQNDGGARIYLGGDNDHFASIFSQHTGNGYTYLAFGTANGNALPTERMRIDKDGNVGIGTTNPTTKLHIPTNSAASNENLLNFKNESDYGIFVDSLGVSSRGNTLDFKARDYNFNTISTRNLLTLRPEGNIGIGITNPSDKLEVNGSSTIIHTSDTIGGGGLYFAHVSNSRTWGLRMGATVRNLHLDCYDSGWKNYVTFLTNGNVGIGKTNPNYKLDFGKSAPGGTAANDYGGMLALYNNDGNYLYGIDADNYGSGWGINFYASMGGKLEGNIRMKIDRNSGNVGIGTTSPGYKLDVNGSLNCTSLNVGGSPFTGGSSLWSTTSPSTTTSDIFYNDSTSITGTAYPQGSLVTITGSISEHSLGSKMGLIVQHSNRTQGLGIGFNGISQCGSSANLHLHLRAKGTGTTKIGSSGGIGLDVSDSRVGIATTPTYQDAKLSINVGDEGTMLASPDISQFLWRINSTSIWGIYWSTNGSGNNYYISGDGNPNEIVFVGSGVAKACVDLDTGSVCSKDWFRTFGNGGIYFSDHGGGWYMNDSTWIRSYGTKKVYVNSEICTDGNIGIGTTSPTNKLDVRGGMRLGDGTTAEQDINFVSSNGNWQVGTNNAGNGTNSNQFFIYDSDYCLTVQKGTGNVGIGRTNPSSKLDVNGEIKCSSLTVNGVAITTNGGGGGSSNDGISITTSGSATNTGTSVSANMGIYSSTYAYIDLRTNNNNGGWIDFSSIDNSDYKVRLRGYNNPQKLELVTGTSVTTIDSGGNLLVPGDITAFYSDERLKKIKTNISDVLSNIENINVFKYENNDLANSLGFKNDKLQIGLSAQEIQKYYPELVELAPFDSEYDIESGGNISKSGENYLTLKYDRLVPILLQGIKELNNKNKLLEERNNKLEKDLELIKNKLGL